MNLKDATGLLFIGAGVTFGALGYKILGFEWYIAIGILIFVGLFLIWSAERGRKIREALDEVSDDWGGMDNVPGSRGADDFDIGGPD